MQSARRLHNHLYRESFTAFAHRSFQLMHPGIKLVPNWHIDAICHTAQKIVLGQIDRRIVINLPPRSLKSFLFSIAYPAWLLGRDPGLNIKCISYNDDLARTLARGFRSLIRLPFYRQIFGDVCEQPLKDTENEFETRTRGGRFATSVDGTITGLGADYVIIDDPMKAQDGYSETARNKCKEWFSKAAVSRQNEAGKTKFVLVMQRLHADDLAGDFISQAWPSLIFPAIATERTVHAIGNNRFYVREIGEVLNKKRDSLAALEEIREQCGSVMFAAQYQQNPTPPEGNMIKPEWLKRYDQKPARECFDKIILTCDPSGKAGEHNDYTALVVSGLLGSDLYILEVRRGHWTVLQMQYQILALHEDYRSNLVITEDTATGSGLIQLLKQQTKLNVIGEHPKDAKQTRLAREQGTFESGRVILPKEAPWLADLMQELFAFPLGKHDDQVDALLLVLEWRTSNAARRRAIPDISFDPDDLKRRPEDCWPSFDNR